MGLHKSPYILKEESLCIKTIEIFNSCQILWKQFAKLAGININKEDLESDLNTGEKMSVVALIAIIEQVLNESIKQTVIDKLSLKACAKKTDSETIYTKQIYAVLKISILYYQIKEEVLSWSDFIQGKFYIDLDYKLLDIKLFSKLIKEKLEDTVSDTFINLVYNDLKANNKGNIYINTRN